MGEAVLRIDDAQQRAGDERAEDRLDAERAGERDEQREQEDRDPHPELRGRVLERDQRLRDPQRPAGFEQRRAR